MTINQNDARVIISLIKRNAKLTEFFETFCSTVEKIPTASLVTKLMKAYPYLLDKDIE